MDARVNMREVRGNKNEKSKMRKEKEVKERRERRKNITKDRRGGGGWKSNHKQGK